MIEEDLQTLCFKDVSWLQMYSLSSGNVLDYFSRSPFYTNTESNNEILKMQRHVSNRETEEGPIIETIEEKLKRMTGYEFALNKARIIEPTLFIIDYLLRKSPTQTSVIHSYYVLDGTVYPSPNLDGVIKFRLKSSLYYLDQGIHLCLKNEEFSSNNNYSWKTNGQPKEFLETNKDELENLLKLNYYLDVLNNKLL